MRCGGAEKISDEAYENLCHIIVDKLIYIWYNELQDNLYTEKRHQAFAVFPQISEKAGSWSC